MLRRLHLFPAHWFSLLLAINGIAPSFSQADCGERGLEKCKTVLDPMMKNPDIVFAQSEGELEVACRYFNQYLDCIKSLANRCYKSYQKDAFLAAFSGIGTVVIDMCTPGSTYRIEFLKHSTCYRSIESELQHCVDVFTAEADELKTAKISDEEKIRRSCCYMNASAECLLEPTVQKCGNAAAYLVKQSFEKIYDPMTMLCSNIEYDSSSCSAASSNTISCLLFFIMMVIMSLKH